MSYLTPQYLEPESMRQALAEVSRVAAMNEVATGVLHNVGNVLNSVNVSITLLRDNLKRSHFPDVGRLAELLRAHQADLSSFLTKDPKGRRVVEFVTQLSEKLLKEQQAQARELESLQKSLSHMKEIISIQQDCARVSGLTEIVQIRELVEDTICLNAASLGKRDIQVVRDFQETPPITVDKHKVMQILVNLLRNAESACEQAEVSNKQLTVALRNLQTRVQISVTDNGIGIAPENLSRIFEHGFTTKKDGHGFGLHSGAVAAKQVGGSLRAYSEGPGRGATFTLELPLQPPA